MIQQFVHLLGVEGRTAMSKREGEYVTLDDLVAEIGVDAARFFLLARSHDTTVDLDLDLAVRESSENPVYYVQYAHARIASVLAKAGADARRGGARRDRARSSRCIRPSARSSSGSPPSRASSRRPPSGARRTASPATRSSSRRTSPPSTATAASSARSRARPSRGGSRSRSRRSGRSPTALGLLGVSAPDRRCDQASKRARSASRRAASAALSGARRPPGGRRGAVRRQRGSSSATSDERARRRPRSGRRRRRRRSRSRAAAPAPRCRTARRARALICASVCRPRRRASGCTLRSSSACADCASSSGIPQVTHMTCDSTA